MLRLLDKENLIPPSENRDVLKIKSPREGESLQGSQKDLAGHATVENMNLEVFEKQLKKLTEACENERKESWGLSQAKNRLQNQVRVLQIEKENQFIENKNLRFELTDLLFKIKDLQAKSTLQLTELCTVRNENTGLQIQLKRYQDCQKSWSERCQQLTCINNELEVQIRRAQGESSFWKNECNLRDTQIELLRRSICESETENRKFNESNRSNSLISEQKFSQICKELENWKNAFEKKEQELQTRTIALQEQNSLMRKTIAEFSDHVSSKKFSLQRSCSLPTDPSEKYNEYQVRLFIKENHIQKLNDTIKHLEERVEVLQLENAIMAKKCAEGTVFSPSAYNKYTQVQNCILRSSESKKEARDLRIEVEVKEKEIECLVEKLNELKQQMESTVAESRKLQSEFDFERIAHQNTVSDLSSTKTKLEKEVTALKEKLEIFKKECSEKDKIIMNYLNKARS